MAGRVIRAGPFYVLARARDENGGPGIGWEAKRDGLPTDASLYCAENRLLT